jgi:hypothetical protein
MSKTVLRVVMRISFFALLPLSWRIGDALFFTRPFNRTLFDPVLLICSDHVGVLKWHEIAKVHDLSTEVRCTFQVASARQAWVETAVRQLQSPNPRKSAWIMHAKQLGGNRQRIDLELVGDGVSGMIYEVQDGSIAPHKSRLTGPFGAVLPLDINIVFWIVIWLVVWGVRRRPVRPAGSESEIGSRKVSFSEISFSADANRPVRFQVISAAV